MSARSMEHDPCRFAAALSALISLVVSALPIAAAAAARLGINLSGPADWNTELPFVDVFKLSRPWISQKDGQPWGGGPDLDLDQYGWVKQLEPDCYAETLLCTIDAGRYPAGTYTVMYLGQGQLDTWGAGKVVWHKQGLLTIQVDPSKGAIFLRILHTDPNDYVRDIRVIMPGFGQTFDKQPFHPAFLNRWKGVACVRFMDWMQTNNSRIVHWQDRPTPQTATFSASGVALEYMIGLCNQLGADAWFCIPHMADDDYIRRFAGMVRDRLDPNLKVYVEYSNEVWNGMFQQHRWAGQQGMQLGFAQRPWEAAWRYYAYRSMQIFRIWQEEFDTPGRLIRVLASQAANTYVSEQILQFQDAYRYADALAIAPYISFNVPAEGQDITAAMVAKWTLEQLLDHVEYTCLPQAIQWIMAQKKIADRYGLRLIAYEAGQHLVGVSGGENNQAMTRLFLAANRHPRMGRIYDRYYQAWQEAGGDLLCYFSSVSRWSKWGSWGIMEFYDQDPNDCPKFLSTMAWARSLGQPVQVCPGPSQQPQGDPGLNNR